MIYSVMKAIVEALEQRGYTLLLAQAALPHSAEGFKNAVDLIVGDVMKATQGRANPAEVRDLVKRSLDHEGDKIVANHEKRKARGPVFQMSQEEWKKAEAWSKTRQYSKAADGARLTYCFTPGGLGTIVTILDEITRETTNVTDFDSW